MSSINVSRGTVFTCDFIHHFWGCLQPIQRQPGWHVTRYKYLMWLTWLDLIHPTSTWTYWATLRRHSCLLRAATSASSQVSPIPRKSFLTMPLQFVLGRPGPLLKPGTSQYSAWLMRLLWTYEFAMIYLHGWLFEVLDYHLDVKSFVSDSQQCIYEMISTQLLQYTDYRPVYWPHHIIPSKQFT